MVLLYFQPLNRGRDHVSQCKYQKSWKTKQTDTFVSFITMLGWEKDKRPKVRAENVGVNPPRMIWPSPSLPLVWYDLWTDSDTVLGQSVVDPFWLWMVWEWWAHIRCHLHRIPFKGPVSHVWSHLRTETTLQCVLKHPGQTWNPIEIKHLPRHHNWKYMCWLRSRQNRNVRICSLNHLSMRRFHS